MAVSRVSEQRHKLPEGKRFEKGRSGNPGGRPKMPEELKELARGHTVLAIQTLARICRSKSATASAQVAAAEVLLSRAWGKPAQAVELTGKDGGAVEISDTSPVEIARRLAYLLGAGLRAQETA